MLTSKPQGFENNMGIRSGDWVEVRSTEEIFATLDEQGRLDALPFMPEMLKYCGKRFQVYRSAHKTCDTIEQYKSRSMTNAVHLEGLRCDGQAHGGCQAGCLLFWKGEWLKRVSGTKPDEESPAMFGVMPSESLNVRSRFGQEALARATRVSPIKGKDREERYRCQATEVLQATIPLTWWDLRQYVKDLSSGNVRLSVFIVSVGIAAYNAFITFNLLGRVRGCWRLSQFLRKLFHPYPYIRGLAEKKTPTELLNLQAGELVQVRSKAEIMRTLNGRQRNRGLSFDVEMLPYCGGTYRVLRRVERIINEKTGVMMYMPNDCIILEGVVCSGCLSRNRLFCPRSIYPYWREIWLKRVEKAESGS